MAIMNNYCKPSFWGAADPPMAEIQLWMRNQRDVTGVWTYFFNYFPGYREY
jgi:hypothetical protein